MSQPLTRADCGFAIFNECDPATCQCDCFTARAIAINEKYRPQPARFSTLALYLILAVSVAVVGLIGFGGAAVVDQGIQNWQNVRTAHVEQ